MYIAIEVKVSFARNSPVNSGGANGRVQDDMIGQDEPIGIFRLVGVPEE